MSNQQDKHTSKHKKKQRNQSSWLSEETLSDYHHKPQTKEISIQTEQQSREYVPMSILSQFNLESEAYPHFIYRSHTITGLIFICAVIGFAREFYTFEDGEFSLMYNGQIGTYFAAFMFCGYGVLYFPNTYMQRPHPAFWRLVHSIGIFWLGLVTFVNFYSKEDLQRFFKVAVDTKLGSPIPERSYAENCEIYTPGHPDGDFKNLHGIVDIFFAAHVTGWTFKMLITRDIKLCLIQSFLFELIELTFKHWLNNFAECWWDSLILDLVICNTGGIMLGYLIIKLFNLKQYRWSMRKKFNKSFFQNARDLVLPGNLVEHHWEMFHSTKRFLGVIFFIFIFQLIDISFFFNKFVLNIEPGHRLCQIRTFLIGFLSMPAAREYYEFLTNKACKRLGPYCWNLIAILTMESLLFFNNIDHSKFTEPFPTHIKIIWSIFGVIFVIIVVVLIINDIKKCVKEWKEKLKKRKQKKHHRKNK